LQSLTQLGKRNGAQERGCAGLIRRWKNSIRTIAAYHAGRRSDLDDLMQVGRLALYRAAPLYRPSREADLLYRAMKVRS
jgi:DNA-directed RNA polymerase specialized sigma subunit